MFSYVISSIVFVDFVTLKEEESSTNYLKTLINRNNQNYFWNAGLQTREMFGQSINKLTLYERSKLENARDFVTYLEKQERILLRLRYETKLIEKYLGVKG